MKKFYKVLLAIVLVLLLCVGCTEEQNSYDDSSSNYETAYDNNDDEYSAPVYVSRTGKIHKKSNCSGMKYYTVMDYDEAVNNGYDFCNNCY